MASLLSHNFESKQVFSHNRPEDTAIHGCTIRYIDYMYEIEKTLPILARDESQKKLMMLGPSEKSKHF